MRRMVRDRSAVLVVAVALASCTSAPPDDVVLELQDGEEEPVAAALWRLREESRVRVRVRFDGRRLLFASFAVDESPGEAMAPASRAMRFLERHADLYGLARPRDALFVSRVVSNDSGDHVFFDQRVGAIPVRDAQLTVHLRGEEVMATNGSYLTDVALDPRPAIDPEDAVRLAMTRSPGARLTGMPKLVFTSERLVRPARSVPGASVEEATRLVWQLTLLEEGSESGAMWLVDARSGEVISASPTDREKDFWIRTVNNGVQTAFCGFSSATDWFDENGVLPGATPDAEGARAFDAADDYYDYLWTEFGRRSFDGRDLQFQLNLDDATPGIIGNAAFRTLCGHFVFGNGMAVRDVVVHELTHGLTHNTAALAGSFEPGALGESYSDVFAAIFDPPDWLIGEGSAAGAARSMADPPLFTSTMTVTCTPPNPLAGCASSSVTFADPDRMSLLITNATNDVGGDFGAVHANAGIPNKAAFLIADGGMFNGVVVRGMGRAKLGRLYYEVLTGWLNPNSGFATAALLTTLVVRLKAADPRTGFTSADVCTVDNAFAAVELGGAADQDCDGQPDFSDSDDDGDGVDDSIDNCPRVANPTQVASDSDGTGNACDLDDDGDGRNDTADNCPLVANAGQDNWDRDDRGDACDDSDADGVLDIDDNCRAVPNPDRKNSDGDRFGDACDADRDGDGWCQLGGSWTPLDPSVPPGGCPARTDLCPLDRDLMNLDSDGDLTGDVCDRCPNAPDTGNDEDTDGIDSACDDDDDGDGILDANDNCPTKSNPTQLDLNGNGVGTACDPLEQIAVSTHTAPLGGDIRRRLERNAIAEIPLVPDPGACAWGDGGVGVELAYEVGAGELAVAAAVVDDEGHFVALAPPASGGVLTFAPQADFCALPVGVDKGAKPLMARRYTFQLLAPDGIPARTGLRVTPRIVPWPTGPGER